MTAVRVQFLGTGGPLASGGRLQSCVLIEAEGSRILLDCGATALVGMARFGIDPDSIDAVLLSHLHGDHFGGLPFLLVDALADTRDHAPGPRRRSLRIAGPAETDDRLRATMEAFGYLEYYRRAKDSGLLELIVLEPGRATEVGPLSVAAFSVPHTPEATALRLTCAGRTVAYSGDTGWSDALIEVAADADLFICQVYTFGMNFQTMLSHYTLAEQRERLSCRRLILTHIGPEMQRNLARSAFEVAEDGMVILMRDT